MFLVASPPGASATVVRKAGTPSANPSGLLNIAPGRIEEDVQPGVRKTLRVRLTDDSEQPFDVSMRGTDVGPSSDPHSVASEAENGEFGAGDWLVPEVVNLRLQPFETVEFDVVVDPPDDAPVGTNLAGLIVQSTVADGPIGTADSTSSFRVDGLIQIFLTIPGPVDHDLQVTDVRLRDSLVLGRHRFAVWDLTFRNRGTVNEHVSGRARVRSIFGNSPYSMQLNDLLVLRGGTRTTRVVWRDLPWVGAFRLEARMRGDDARPLNRESERMYILPWWLPVVLVLSILLPFVYLWWRRRREWRMYLDDEGDVHGFEDDDGLALS
ncbi:MAG: hypothetical protein JWM98_2812 [Thermoleophilia bacterium]|nr:hypothetical protein [Thermoleophilia bacterium]